MVMMGVYTLNAIDRNVISVVLEPIKREFGLSDAQAGLLGSITHGAAYALTSIPLGLLADRVNRVRLICALSVIWSGFTIACGYTNGAMQLALARVGVGAAEGGFSPSALSLIGDFFPARRRATAIGIFYLSTAIGTCLIFLMGGAVAARYGWRAVFLVAGLPGIPLALLLFTVREPRRGAYDESSVHATKSAAVLSELWNNPSVVFAMLGITLGVIAVTAFWVWSTSFYIRIHGLGIARIGVFMAIATGPAQAMGSLLAGPVADRIVLGRPDRVGLVPACGLVTTIPVGLFMLFCPVTPLSLAGLVVLGFVVGTWLPQSFATALVLARPVMRGATMGVVYLVVNLVGTGLGPAWTGFLSDRLGADAAALRGAMAITVLLCLPAAFCLVAAGRTRSR